LPTIILETIEGGQKGKKVALATQDVITRFFTIGAVKMENKCNRFSSKHRDEWMAKASEIMLDYGITYGDGCNELVPSFKLFEPASIHINILDSECPWGRNTSAVVIHSRDTVMNPTINIYLKALELRDSTIIWIGFTTPFDHVINHELLHVCGDSPEIVEGIRDGVIRHTLICNEAIDNLTGDIGG
jgi:hypothetical protein